MPWGIIEDFLNEHGGPQAREIGWHELPLSVVIQYAIEGDEGAIEFLKRLPPPTTPAEPPPLKVPEHQGARTETFDWNEDDHPRDESGRFGPGSGGDGAKASDPQREAANVEATETATAKMIEALETPDGGFTLDYRTGETPTEGYAVADFRSSSITPGAEWRAMPRGEKVEALRDFLRQNQDKFREDPELKVGGWFDPNHNEVVLDPVRVIADRTEAVERGWINDQQSIADLGAINRGDWDSAIIPTHGSGRRDERAAAGRVSYDRAGSRGMARRDGTGLVQSRPVEARQSRQDDRRHHGNRTEERTGTPAGASGHQAAAPADSRDVGRGTPGVRGDGRGRDRQGVRSRGDLDALEGRYGHLSAREVADLAIGGDDWAVVWLLAAYELADEGGLAARAWFEYDPDLHPKGDDGRFIESGGGDAAPADLPAGWHEAQLTFDPNIVAGYRNGDISLSVTARAAEKVPIEIQHKIMDRLAALKETDPIGAPLRVSLVSPAEMRSKNAAGETFTNASGSSVMQLNAGVLGPEYQPMGDTVGKKMPDVSYHDYLVAHEYGHALQGASDLARDDARFVRERSKIMRDTEPPSAYGNIRLTNRDEAYAEAYADWRLNPGEPGPLAQKLAEHEGWKSR